LSNVITVSVSLFYSVRHMMEKFWWPRLTVTTTTVKDKSLQLVNDLQ